MRLGLIGKSLGHSWSPKYFREKFERLGLEGYSYELFEISDISEFPKLIKQHPDLHGLNVTVPYKQSIMPFLDGLTEEARTVGAVNTLYQDKGNWIGHNTDVAGFEALLQEVVHGTPGPAMVLGTGGAAQAVRFVLERKGIPFQFISRDPNKGLTYEALTKAIAASHPLIIQATPVGMYPDVKAVLPFPFDAIGTRHVVVDLIYNPEQTEFMKCSARQGAQVANGLTMLYAQAEASWEVWEEDD